MGWHRQACAALGLLALASCAEFEALRDIPLEDGEVTFVVVHDRDGARTVRVVQREALSSLYLRPGDEAWVLAYRLTAAQMQLPLGEIEPDSLRPREVPPGRRALRWREDRFEVGDAPDLARYRLPVFDAARCAEGCRAVTEGALHCSQSCASTVEAPAAPALPSYPTWGPVVGGVPGPPPIPDALCPVGERYDVHEARCVGIDACPEGLFREAPDEAAVYVLEGAVGGDGTEQAPFGTLREALAGGAGPRTIMLGPGLYRAPNTNPYGYRLVGRCVASTTVSDFGSFGAGSEVSVEHLTGARAGGQWIIGNEVAFSFAQVDLRDVHIDVDRRSLLVMGSAIRGASRSSVVVAANESNVSVSRSQLSGPGIILNIDGRESSIGVRVQGSVLLGTLDGTFPELWVSTGPRGVVELERVRAGRASISIQGPKIRAEDIAVSDGIAVLSSADVVARGVYVGCATTDRCGRLYSGVSDGRHAPNIEIENAFAARSVAITDAGYLWGRHIRAASLELWGVRTFDLADVFLTQSRDERNRVEIEGHGLLTHVRALSRDLPIRCRDCDLTIEDLDVVGALEVGASGESSVTLERVATTGGIHLLATEEARTSGLHVTSSSTIGAPLTLRGAVDLQHFDLHGGDVAIELESTDAVRLRDGRVTGAEVLLDAPDPVSALRALENVRVQDVPHLVPPEG